MAFTVLNPLDLNLNPHYREPIHMQFEKTFCCLCCASAPLAVDVRAPVSGYCAGQTVPIEIDVDNKSNVQLHLVKVYLRKVVTFRATMPKSTTKKTKHVIVETKEGPAPENTIKHWSLKLEIPPLPPSNLVNCSIIDLDYDLKVECVVSGVHMNLSDKKCITIGTVPLMEGAMPSPAASNGQPAPGQASYGVPDQPAPYGVPGQPAPYAVPGQPAPYAVPGQPAPYAVPPGQPAPYGVPGQPAVQPSSPAQPYGPSPTPSAPSLPTPPAGGEAPSAWVMPAPAPSPYPHPSGPGPAPGQPLPQSLYPMLDPIFKESMDTARTIQDRNDSEHVRIIGATNFAPRYPTYAAVQPPPLPR